MAAIRERPRGDGTIGYAVLYTMDRRQSSLTFDDPKKAEAFKAAIDAHGAARALEMHGINADPRRRTAPELTVTQWLKRHVDQLTGVEQKCIDDYTRYIENDIDPVIGSIPLAALAEEDIARWVRTLEDSGNSPKTIKNKHGFLSGALSKAAAKHLIPANPAAGRRLPRATNGDSDDQDDKRMLSREEFDRLLAATTEYWRPLVEFLVRSGCRWGEAVALKPSDVDRKAGTVRIRRAWKHSSKGYYIGAPKTKRSNRKINVSKKILDQLDYSHEWLFVNRAGGPVRYHGFRRRVWDKAVARAKLDPPPTPHDLRHTCGSWMILAGVPMAVVSRHLGHENIQITVDTYGDVDRTSFKAAAEAIDKLLDDDKP